MLSYGCWCWWAWRFWSPLASRSSALAKRVQVLEGILPICSFCKKIRRPDGQWEQIETYIGKRSAAQFSHGFCEACGREHYGK